MHRNPRSSRPVTTPCRAVFRRQEHSGLVYRVQNSICCPFVRPTAREHVALPAWTQPGVPSCPGAATSRPMPVPQRHPRPSNVVHGLYPNKYIRSEGISVAQLMGPSRMYAYIPQAAWKRPGTPNRSLVACHAAHAWCTGHVHTKALHTELKIYLRYYSNSQFVHERVVPTVHERVAPRASKATAPPDTRPMPGSQHCAAPCGASYTHLSLAYRA